MPEPEYHEMTLTEAEALLDRRLREAFPDIYRKPGDDQAVGDSVAQILADLDSTPAR